MYSASGQSLPMMERQAARMCLSLGVMFILAQIAPRHYETWAPYLFGVGLVLLLGVLLFGEASKGAQRWLNLGFVRFQPSELIKLAVPLMVARFISSKPLPPTFTNIVIALVLVFVPTILIAKQPDLGTSILIATSEVFVLFLSGMRRQMLIFQVLWRLISAFQERVLRQSRLVLVQVII
jgi:rod shape determining protein RodA